MLYTVRYGEMPQTVRNTYCLDTSLFPEPTSGSLQTLVTPATWYLKTVSCL